eukprot:6209223-Pleurochrysis_carterae.AAC.7
MKDWPRVRLPGAKQVRVRNENVCRYMGRIAALPSPAVLLQHVFQSARQRNSRTDGCAYLKGARERKGWWAWRGP